MHKGNTPSCMISMQVPRGNSKFTEVVSILTPMYMDEVSKWTDTTPEHRGEAYRQFKEEKDGTDLAAPEAVRISLESLH